ncbi:MAG: tetratricopeptide repeat protein [Candidatus Pacearchaeota archaeon]
MILNIDWKEIEKGIKNNNPEAYYKRGVIYLIAGDAVEKAILDFRKAIELNPNFSEAYCALGMASHWVGNLEKAIECYNKAIEIDPNNVDAYFNRAAAYEALGKKDEAEKDYSKAMELVSTGKYHTNNLQYP